MSEFAGQLSRKGECHFCRTEQPRLAPNQHLGTRSGPGSVIHVGRGHGRQPRHRSGAGPANPTLPSLDMYLRERDGWPRDKRGAEGKASYLSSQASLLLNNGGREETFRPVRAHIAKSAGEDPRLSVSKSSASASVGSHFFLWGGGNAVFVFHSSTLSIRFKTC